MKPNAVYYYVSAVLYAGLGLYLWFGNLPNLALIDWMGGWFGINMKVWFGILLVCLGIFRASRGWQMQRRGKIS